MSFLSLRLSPRLSPRFLLLFVCTASTFVVLGRAPAAVTPRTREIEAAIEREGKSGREKRAAIVWRGRPAAV